MVDNLSIKKQVIKKPLNSTSKWKEGVSNTYPDRVFYYNEETKDQTWDLHKKSRDTKTIKNHNANGKLKSLCQLAKYIDETNNKKIGSKTVNGIHARISKVKVSNNTIEKEINMTINKSKNHTALKKSGQKQPLITPQMRIAMLKKSSNNNVKDSQDICNASTSATQDKINQASLLKKNGIVKNLDQQLVLTAQKEREPEAENSWERKIQGFEPKVNTVSHKKKLLQFEELKNFDNFDDDVEDDAMKNIMESVNESVGDFVDWDAVNEKSILKEIAKIKQNTFQSNNLNFSFPKNQFQLSLARERELLCIVVDTETLILKIKWLKTFLKLERVNNKQLLIIPGVVVKELYKIKKYKSVSDNVKHKAAEAISILKDPFFSQHIYIYDQTADEDTNLGSGNLIWQTCLQMKNDNFNVALFTLDEDLQNIAMNSSIQVINQETYLAFFNDIEVNVSSDNHFLSDERTDALTSDNISIDETIIIETISLKLQNLLYKLMTEILNVESKILYNDNWKKHVKINPSWTLLSLLKYVELQWTLVTYEAFKSRQAFKVVQRLQGILQITPENLKMKDIFHFLNIVNQLIEMLDENKYSTISTQISQQIDKYRCICLEQDYKFRELKLEEHVDKAKDENEIKRREESGFEIFSQIYLFYRDISGKLSQKYHIPCAYIWDTHRSEECTYSTEQLHYLMHSLISLIKILKVALDEICFQQINYETILSLFNILLINPGKLNDNFTLLDIFYCLKNKEAALRSGLSQYEEIYLQFCTIVDSLKK